MVILKCPNEFGLYDSKIYLEFPEYMLSVNGGYYSTKTGATIDICIVDEIRYLWSQGIVTYGSCCGHGRGRGMVNVGDNDLDIMYKLGYEKDTSKMGMSSNAFFLKSNHKHDYEILSI